MDLQGLAGILRYGVPTQEKERLAREASLPGAPEDNTAEQTAADRYAAGFLFGLRYPELAVVVQPYVDRLKTSDLPLFGGSTPEEQSYASEGVQRGAAMAGQGLTLAELLRE